MKNWLFEIYQLLCTCNTNDFSKYLDEFGITSEELKIMHDVYKQSNKIKRDLILYELSEVIDIWDHDEIVEMMQLYGISETEVSLIFTELYMPFSKKVLTGENTFTRKKEEKLSSLILIWDTLSIDEKEAQIRMHNLSNSQISIIDKKSSSMTELIKSLKLKNS